MRIKHKLSCTMASVLVMLSVFADTNITARATALRMFDKLNKLTFKKIKLKSDNHDTENKILTLQPRVISATQTAYGVFYTFHNGETIERIGGTIAWRNNNPGCIRYSNKAVSMGAIGSANGFAIFPDEETGMRAIKTLLLSDGYRNLNIASAIGIYAPPHENNTEHYINALCGLVGVSRSTRLCDLNDNQLECVVNSIRRLEGWIVGTEKFTPTMNNNRISVNQSDLQNRLEDCTVCWFVSNSR